MKMLPVFGVLVKFVRLALALFLRSEENSFRRKERFDSSCGTGNPDRSEQLCHANIPRRLGPSLRQNSPTSRSSLVNM